MRMLTQIIVTALLLSFFTSALFSIWSPAAGAPEIIHIREEDSKEFSIVIAGNLNQASNVAKQVISSLKGNVVAFDFPSNGYHPHKFVKAVKEYIATLPEDAKISIYSVSLGTQPGQTIASDLGLVLYAINPCINSLFLQPDWRGWCYAMCIASPLIYAAGWISHIPFIGYFSKAPDHRNYSLIMLFDQFLSITFRHTTKPQEDKIVVRISERDQILNNSKVKKYYSAYPIVSIDTDHGNTVGYQKEYCDGIKEAQEIAKNLY